MFGDDVSTDQTLLEINKIKSELKNIEINSYEGPGICKSENVYKGIEISSGDIIIIYDADHTVSFDDIEFAIKILINSNADFINCTRMIYPQKDGAMKNLNFLEIVFLLYYLAYCLKKKLQILYVVLKFFYKKIG